MQPDVSILILAHNKVDYTQRCLDSLFDSTLRPFQVVLVDNGSTDATQACFHQFERQAASEQIDVEIVTLPENKGAIVGRNIGMTYLRGAYWVFLDNDICVRSRSWLQQLRGVLEREKEVGVVGPKLVYPMPPHHIQCAGCEVTPEGQVTFRGRGEPRTAEAFNTPVDCQTLISACWMLRRDVAEAIGPLDEQFSPVQFEDIDYCYRIREFGRRCRYVPQVEMYHFENVTTGRTGTLNYPYLTVKNGLKFKKKWRHCFENEGGPEAWTWKEIDTIAFDAIPDKLERIP